MACSCPTTTRWRPTAQDPCATAIPSTEQRPLRATRPHSCLPARQAYDTLPPGSLRPRAALGQGERQIDAQRGEKHVLTWMSRRLVRKELEAEYILGRRRNPHLSCPFPRILRQAGYHPTYQRCCEHRRQPAPPTISHHSQP